MSVPCRFCRAALDTIFVDLGSSPLANSYLSADDLQKMEPFYPLTVYVCSNCLLVQVPEVVGVDQIFSDYAYFSSFSDSWVEHARRYSVDAAARYGIGEKSLVVEIASNDGYLLQHFAGRGVPVLGIEPAANVADAAKKKGINTLVRFFGTKLATELRDSGKRADLIVGNNVLAHVPDLNGFVEGLRILLADSGVITIEVPHLLELMKHGQFDTIYHEHFSYFTLHVLRRVFAAHHLNVFDVEQLDTHGGSLRIHAAHAGASRPDAPAIERVLGLEQKAGLSEMAGHRGFDARVQTIKQDVLLFLIDAKRRGRKVLAYGAPAKGNTLLNYCGVRPDFIPFTVDRSPHKQNRFLPGSRIPIRAPQDLLDARPDYVLILPWNLRDEIVGQMGEIATWGGKFVVAVPALEVIG